MKNQIESIQIVEKETLGKRGLATECNGLCILANKPDKSTRLRGRNESNLNFQAILASIYKFVYMKITYNIR